MTIAIFIKGANRIEVLNNTIKIYSKTLLCFYVSINYEINKK